MSDYRSRTIECDQCGRTHTLLRASRRELLRRARADGWDLGSGSVADLCPSCGARRFWEHQR